MEHYLHLELPVQSGTGFWIRSDYLVGLIDHIKDTAERVGFFVYSAGFLDDSFHIIGPINIDSRLFCKLMHDSFNSWIAKNLPAIHCYLCLDLRSVSVIDIVKLREYTTQLNGYHMPCNIELSETLWQPVVHVS